MVCVITCRASALVSGQIGLNVGGGGLLGCRTRLGRITRVVLLNSLIPFEMI